MASIPNDYQDLFDKKTFAHIATLTSAGVPHVTPLWVDYDATDDRLLINTATGRQKLVNLRNDPRVGLSMTDPDDPYRALSVLGEADDVTEEGAADHIDSLARRYRGNDRYQGDRSKRVIVKIRPDHVLTK